MASKASARSNWLRGLKKSLIRREKKILAVMIAFVCSICLPKVDVHASVWEWQDVDWGTTIEQDFELSEKQIEEIRPAKVEQSFPVETVVNYSAITKASTIATTATTITTVTTTAVTSTTSFTTTNVEEVCEDSYEYEYEYDNSEIVQYYEESEEYSYEQEETANNVLPTGADYQITDYEYTILCNIVGHEYGSDYVPIEEKGKVVEVVMNRVNSDLYPNSIYEVISQPGQFAGYENYAISGEFTYQVTDSVRESVDDYLQNTEKYNHGYTSFSGDGQWNYFN